MQEDNLEELRARLRTYRREDIIFNEPHFTMMLELREGSKEELMQNLLRPDKLEYSYTEHGRHGNDIHVLHFRKSNTRTLRIPVMFNKGGRKNLYILTYIIRYRPWQSMKRGRK